MNQTGLLFSITEKITLLKWAAEENKELENEFPGFFHLLTTNLVLKKRGEAQN